MQTDEHRDRRRLYPWVGATAGLVLVVAAAWAVEFIPGDVNDDGVFNIADPTVLRRELAGLGPGIAQLCGNRVLDPGEECDAGVSCSDLGFAFGELDCGAGCVAEVDTCTNTRFEDLGLTVIDHQTGLEWEKKTGSVGLGFPPRCDFSPDDDGACSDLSNVDNMYVWDVAMGEWTSRLNGLAVMFTGSQSGLAGHTNWRLPTMTELFTILDRLTATCLAEEDPGPGCIDSIFGPVRSFRYWSSSSLVDDPDTLALAGDFSEADDDTDLKSRAHFVRAVRDRGPRAEGQPCHGDARCEPGLLCVDGVCCASACSGVCESCRSASTGSPNGTCAFITGGTDPDSECVSPAICGSGAVAGACCAPTTCGAAGQECDRLQGGDGCGGSPFCGVCTPGFGCFAGRCEESPL